MFLKWNHTRVFLFFFFVVFHHSVAPCVTKSSVSGHCHHLSSRQNLFSVGVIHKQLFFFFFIYFVTVRCLESSAWCENISLFLYTCMLYGYCGNDEYQDVLQNNNKKYINSEMPFVNVLYYMHSFITKRKLSLSAFQKPTQIMCPVDPWWGARSPGREKLLSACKNIYSQLLGISYYILVITY